MKVYRFMSRDEFKAFKKGQTLINEKKHVYGKTSSIGFCFLDLEEYKPEYAMHFLSGIVMPEICAVFEVDEKELNKTWGIYAKPYENLQDILNNWRSTFRANEYCTTSYSNKTFKLLKYAKPILFDYTYKDWEFVDAKK